MPWGYIPIYAIILLGPTLFLSATGQYLSLAFRKGIVGAVLNLLLGLTLWLGIWIALGLLSWFGDFFNNEFWDSVQKFPFSITPALMAGTSSAAIADNPRTPISLQRFEMFDVNLRFGEYMSWLLGAFAFYLLATLAVFWATVRSFRRLSGRSS
jgi:hypothetical protein